MVQPRKIGLIFSIVLLGLVAFLIGIQISARTQATQPNLNTPVKFVSIRSLKPQLSFFSTSFCPYTSNLISTLEPISNLLTTNLSLQPHYLFLKISNLDQFCRQTSGDQQKCQLYINRGLFTSLDQCRQNIQIKNASCLNQKLYLRSPNGNLYTSIYGRQEASQNIREVCAFRLTKDKASWWKFIRFTNQNCNYENADLCWQDQAEASSLDPHQITECFNKDAFTIIEEELAAQNRYQISSSPTILINEMAYQPEKRKLIVGEETIDIENLRTPDTFKKIICDSFPISPEVCSQSLPPAQFLLTNQQCVLPNTL